MNGAEPLPESVGSTAQTPSVLSVSALNRQVALLLGRQFPLVWVRGEISNFTRAASGHCYFSLKDERAQARAVMFRSSASAVPFELRNGLRVDAHARVGLYEARGDFQLTIERLRAAGTGDLHQQFLALRDRLQREGLFDEAIKRSPMTMPRRLGVVTSLQAAALRDVLITLARRAPHVPVIVYPTPVQGAEAALRIVAALALASQRQECDTLLLVRGGGAIEDLWSFNDERVARAIRACAMPVVVGVGHESDVTIADFAADVRAATPTAAAVLAAPDRSELHARSVDARLRLMRAMRRLVEQQNQRTDTAVRLLKTPREQWRAWRARLEVDARRLQAAQARALERSRQRVQRLEERLQKPDTVSAERRLTRLSADLVHAQSRLIRRRRERLDALAAQLVLVNPQRVLERGYAVVRNDLGQVVTSVDGIRRDDLWNVTVADGNVQAVVAGVVASPVGDRGTPASGGNRQGLEQPRDPADSGE